METTHELRNGLPVITVEQKMLFRQSFHSAKVKAKWTEVRPRKTDKQNKMFWGLLMPYAKAGFDKNHIDFMGISLNHDMIKKILYKYCGGVGLGGENKTISQMNIDEMTKFYENCKNFLAQWNIQVPEADPNWRTKIKVQ